VTITWSAGVGSSSKNRSAALLAGATKKAKTTSHLVYPGEAGREAAARWLALDAELAETERELGLVREQILDVIRPWHEETCARRHAHEPTVVINGPRRGKARPPR
jgi:hypothetical protein